jgi:hypothetical protein
MAWVNQATDAFTRANETPLAGNWTSPITGEQAVNLTTNQVVTTSDNDSSARYSGRTWANDHSSSALITTPGSSGGNQGIGVCVRAASGARTYYRFIVDHAGASNAALHRVIAGAQTVLDTWTQTFTDGDRFTLRVNGPASAAFLEVLRAGASVRTFTDNSSLASGSPGLAYSSAAVSGTWDDWEGGELVGAGRTDQPSLPLIYLRKNR